MPTTTERDAALTVQEVRGQLKTLCERASAGHDIWFGPRGKKQFVLISAERYVAASRERDAAAPEASPYAGIAAALKAGRFSAPLPSSRRRHQAEPDNTLSFAEMVAAGAETAPARRRTR